MVRAPFYDKNGLKKGAWSLEEDNKLKAYIHRYGHSNWRELPKFAGLSRCGKSCRLRWMNYLRPNLKLRNFTKEEEDIIIKLHQELGKKWSVMATKLPGRTDNEIKNHWHSQLKKREKQNPSTFRSNSEAENIYVVATDSDIHPIDMVAEECSSSSSLSPFADASGDFWSEPFIADNYNYCLISPVCMYSDDDATDLFFQVKKELQENCIY